MPTKKQILILILFILSLILYYNLTEPKIQTATVTEIVDGDTLKTDANQIIRLKGINTPEKSQPFYNKAKDFLIQKIQNKTIQIEPHSTDKYGRTLAYIFLNNQNINEQLLKQGLATLYYYNEDKYYSKLKQAETFAMLNQKNLWQKSPDADCIQILSFQYQEPEILTLQNSCDKKLEITIKDDSTHIYTVTLNPKSQIIKNFSHIWNNDGDSIYIYDTKGLLKFQRY